MQDSDTLVFKPSEEDFQDTMEDVVRLFEETVLTVPSLKSDSESDSEDCDPMEEEEASCFLKLILEGSSSLQSIKQSTRESIRFSFEAAKVYGRTFETFSESFEENKGLDPEPEQQQDLDVAYYNKKLESDKRRLNQISYIQDKRSLGLLLVENAQLAKKCQTSSRLSFKATSEVIVQKAIRRRDIVLNRMSETLSKLKTKPSTKAEMLNYIKFLKTTNRKTLELEDTVIPVCQMYEVIQTYSLNLSYQDVIDFESLYPCFDDYLVQVSKYIVDMDGTMKKQCQSLDVDLKELQYP
ncbi:dynein heavy chain 6, axonemal-like [Kryptolebias marmoratus]|uniref:dynein heavy chain 6, axonemal-like n=1 Tax=Kryptolebias marmoratus TaxID=37003 RepID=UPI0018ACABF4|nr:dynein heavy chain 6, axonemal-like [Kryptolebias marmoratus]